MFFVGKFLQKKPLLPQKNNILLKKISLFSQKNKVKQSFELSPHIRCLIVALLFVTAALKSLQMDEGEM